MEPLPPDETRDQLAPDSQARAVLKTLPSTLQEMTLPCPLCGAVTSARGLRARPLRGVDARQWLLVFTCPACGLINAFDVTKVAPEQVEEAKRTPNTAWLEELRHFGAVPRSDTLNYMREAGWQQFMGTFTIAFITWLLLIGNFNVPEVLWGLAVSLIVARLTYRFAAIDLPSWALQPRRWRAFAALVVEYVRQLVVQNVTLSIRVLRPGLPIRPGIVAVPTRLTGDVPLTILGSLMTLTPDTVTMDVDAQRGLIYVHWIDVKTQDADEMYKLISASLEEKITRWLL